MRQTKLGSLEERQIGRHLPICTMTNQASLGCMLRVVEEDTTDAHGRGEEELSNLSFVRYSGMLNVQSI